MTSHICDGCGRAVDEGHVRERILRLEAATRFRPLHIATLLMVAAPPARLTDDFYWLEPGEASSPQAQFLHRQLLEAVGVTPGDGNDRARELSEFQRAGFYLAYLLECPVPVAAQPADGLAADALSGQASTLATRIRYSYKPKRVILLGRELSGVAERLKDAGLGSLLGEGGHAPVPLPAPGDAAATAAFREAMAAQRKGTTIASASE